MENKGSKVLTIVALCVGVVALTLGFAAFSRNLTINPTTNVTPTDEAFGVEFVADKDDETIKTISEIDKSETASAGSPVIASDGELFTIANLTATLTKPEDYVTYTFYVKNTGSFPAILKSISLGSGRKGCTAKAISGEKAVTGLYGACNSINLAVEVDNAKIETSVGNTGLEVTELENGLESAELTGNATVLVDDYSTVKVTLSYDGDGLADGDFEVLFDTVTMNFKSS